MDHIKPTPEELEANAKKALEDLEKLELEENPTEEEVVTPVEEEVEVIPVPEDPPEDKEDIAAKYRESSREAQKLAEDKRKIDSALHEAHNIDDPTEEELIKAYPDRWDLMSDTEKILAKDNLINKRKLALIEHADEQRKTIDDWNDKVERYTENPKLYLAVPELEGKQEKFKEYAKDKGRRNTSFTLLVSAFLHDNAKTKVEHKGEMFPTGSNRSAEKTKPKSDKISVEQAKILRESDYKKYTEYVKAGKIETDF